MENEQREKDRDRRKSRNLLSFSLVEWSLSAVDLVLKFSCLLNELVLSLSLSLSLKLICFSPRFLRWQKFISKREREREREREQKR